jgi:hypothetical protein
MQRWAVAVRTYMTLDTFPRGLMAMGVCMAVLASCTRTPGPEAALSFRCEIGDATRCLAGEYEPGRKVVIAAWSTKTCESLTGRVVLLDGPEGKMKATPLESRPSCDAENNRVPVVVLDPRPGTTIHLPVEVSDSALVSQASGSAVLRATIDDKYRGLEEGIADIPEVIGFGGGESLRLIQFRYRDYDVSMDPRMGAALVWFHGGRFELLDGRFGNSRSMYVLVSGTTRFLAYMAMDREGCENARVIAYEIAGGTLVKRLDERRARFRPCPSESSGSD